MAGHYPFARLTERLPSASRARIEAQKEALRAALDVQQPVVAKLEHRLDLTTQKGPGWDAKAICEIAEKSFGGYENMFKHHQWPERGSKMMLYAGQRIKATYGSVADFVEDWNQKQASDG